METAETDFELKFTEEMTARFVQETNDLLQNLEQGLLNWHKSPKEMDIIGGLF